MLVVASIASFLVALDLLVVTTAIDSMRRDLDVDAAVLHWTVTGFGLTFASFLMAGAALGDRYGRRRLLVIGLATYVMGSVMATTSAGVPQLVAGRIVQGAAAAIVVPVSLTIVATTFPPERRGAAIGALEGITALAVIAGPLAGGAISAYLSWEWIFWIDVPLGLLAIPCVFAVIDESRGQVVPVASLTPSSTSPRSRIGTSRRGPSRRLADRGPRARLRRAPLFRGALARCGRGSRSEDPADHGIPDAGLLARFGLPGRLPPELPGSRQIEHRNWGLHKWNYTAVLRGPHKIV